MKKLFATMLAILATGVTYALPVGNPSEASLLCDGLFWEGNCCDDSFDLCNPCINWCDAFSLRVGFYGDYVFNRHLNAHETDDTAFTGNVIEHAEIYTNAGYLALNFWNKVDIFSSLGATNLFINTNALTFGGLIANGQRFELETDTHFSWSIGGRVTLWECGCTALGFEGQYFRVNTPVKRVTVASVFSLYPGTSEGDSSDPRYSEWQVGFGLSHRINMFVPYIAVKYARATWDFHDTAYLVGDNLYTPGELNAGKRWGYAVGVSLIDCEKAALSVEGRFADEKAAYVNGQIRF